MGSLRLRGRSETVAKKEKRDVLEWEKKEDFELIKELALPSSSSSVIIMLGERCRESGSSAGETDSSACLGENSGGERGSVGCVFGHDVCGGGGGGGGCC